MVIIEIENIINHNNNYALKQQGYIGTSSETFEVAKLSKDWYSYYEYYIYCN